MMSSCFLTIRRFNLRILVYLTICLRIEKIYQNNTLWNFRIVSVIGYYDIQMFFLSWRLSCCTFQNICFLKGNAQFIENRTFGLKEKTIAQFRKMLPKISMNTHATISIMLFANLFTMKRRLILSGEKKKPFIGKHWWWTLSMAAALLKNDSNAGILLWFLQNFKQQLLCKTSAKSCFFDSVNTFDAIRFYHILTV